MAGGHEAVLDAATGNVGDVIVRLATIYIKHIIMRQRRWYRVGG